MKYSIKTVVVIFSVFCLAFVSWANAEEPLSVRMQELQHKIEEAGADWEVGESEISRLSSEDFTQLLGLLEDSDDPWSYGIDNFDDSAYPRALPASFDWRNYNGKNYMTSVKNQGSCGSCWAFAANAAFEARLKIDKNRTYDLSEQLLVSSCSSAGDCAGGYPSKVAAFIKDSGVPEESCYPYKASNSQCSEACSGWKGKAIKATSTYSVSRDVNALKTAIYNKGPVHLGFMVYSDFQKYKGGIYQYVSGKKQGGHAVVAMGWNDAQKYFIVKNSWGKNWGESGYFRIAYSQVSDTSIQFGMMANVFGEDINHDPVPSEDELQNGREVTVNGNEDGWRYYFIDVPSNSRNLVIKSSGGTGDTDIYTKFGSKPTGNDFDCRPWKHGNNESCRVASPSVGQYYVGLFGYKNFSNAKLIASYESGSGPAPSDIASDGFESKNFSGGKGWSGKWSKSGDVLIIEKSPREGRYYLRMRKNTGHMERKVNLSSASAPKLIFSARVRSFELTDKAFVKVSSDGVNYEVAKEFTSADSNNQWKEYTIDLSPYTLTSAFSILFDSEMNKAKDYLYLDDIKIVQ